MRNKTVSCVTVICQVTVYSSVYRTHVLQEPAYSVFRVEERTAQGSYLVAELDIQLGDSVS